MIRKPTTLIEYLEYFINTQKRLFAQKRLAANTIKTYTARVGHLKGFIALHKMEGCLPSDVSVHFIREYEMYLYTKKKLCTNYSMKCIHILDRVLRMALENEDIKNNPCNLFEFHYERSKEIVSLELADLEKIKALKLGTFYRRTRDIFLFGCYTGLAFSDIQNIRKENIIPGPDGKDWIHIKRQKNGSDTYVPLLPEAEFILKYYYYKMPQKSNQRVNQGLKDIGKMAQLKQVLTSHVARKTFGNILHNELNVPLETVSRMLGHKSIHTTESWYVKTNVKKIMNDMKGIQFSRVA